MHVCVLPMYAAAAGGVGPEPLHLGSDARTLRLHHGCSVCLEQLQRLHHQPFNSGQLLCEPKCDERAGEIEVPLEWLFVQWCGLGSVFIMKGNALLGVWPSLFSRALPALTAEHPQQHLQLHHERAAAK